MPKSRELAPILIICKAEPYPAIFYEMYIENKNKNTRASKSLKEWEQSNIKFTHSYKNCSYENGCIQ